MIFLRGKICPRKSYLELEMEPRVQAAVKSFNSHLYECELLAALKTLKLQTGQAASLGSDQEFVMEKVRESSGFYPFWCNCRAWSWGGVFLCFKIGVEWESRGLRGYICMRIGIESWVKSGKFVCKATGVCEKYRVWQKLKKHKEKTKTILSEISFLPLLIEKMTCPSWTVGSTETFDLILSFFSRAEKYF